MTTTIRILTVALIIGLAGTALAQEVPYDKARGEESPGTQMPTQEQLMNTIRSGAPTAVMSQLEYAERLECYKCVPLVENMVLTSSNAQLREFGAWWLRRRLFALSRVYDDMVSVLATDSDSVRRARAAAALGEFLVPAVLTPLSQAAMNDSSAQVRAAAVLALGRLDHPDGNAVIADAMADSDASVRRAATSVVLKTNFFSDYGALINNLADSDAHVRRESAQVLGEFRVPEAASALIALLQGDSDRDVRQAAAWALGRIGGSAARQALAEAQTTETDSLVLDAIRVALAM